MLTERENERLSLGCPFHLADSLTDAASVLARPPAGPTRPPVPAPAAYTAPARSPAAVAPSSPPTRVPGPGCWKSDVLRRSGGLPERSGPGALEATPPSAFSWIDNVSGWAHTRSIANVLGEFLLPCKAGRRYLWLSSYGDPRSR